MPFCGSAPFDPSYTCARYRTLIVSAFSMACALFAFAPVAAAQGVDVSSTTRLEGVLASIRARDPKAAPGLIAQFAVETEPGIRAWIVRGTAGLDVPTGAVLARKALSDASALVRMAAAEALVKADGPDAVADLAAALAGETNAGVRHNIVSWLGSIKTGAARAALQQALAGDSDPNVRIQAARSLQRLGSAAAKKAVKAAKNDPDPRVRAIANEP